MFGFKKNVAVTQFALNGIDDTLYSGECLEGDKDAVEFITWVAGQLDLGREINTSRARLGRRLTDTLKELSYAQKAAQSLKSDVQRATQAAQEYEHLHEKALAELNVVRSGTVSQCLQRENRGVAKRKYIIGGDNAVKLATLWRTFSTNKKDTVAHVRFWQLARDLGVPLDGGPCLSEFIDGEAVFTMPDNEGGGKVTRL